MQDVVEENGTSCHLVSHISFGFDPLGPGRSGFLPAVLHLLSDIDASGVVHFVPFHAIDDVVNKAMLKSEAGRNKKRK